jgi:hypothetical protein
MSKYTLIPGIGNLLGLVQVGDLPKKLPPPKPETRIEAQGPEWKQVSDAFNAVYSYHGHGNPGASWKKNCDLLDQFWCVRTPDDLGMWSGIHLFLQAYKDLGESEKAKSMTDAELGDAIFSAVVGGRAHLMCGTWRSWTDFV